MSLRSPVFLQKGNTLCKYDILVVTRNNIMSYNDTEFEFCIFQYKLGAGESITVLICLFNDEDHKFCRKPRNIDYLPSIFLSFGALYCMTVFHHLCLDVSSVRNAKKSTAFCPQMYTNTSVMAQTSNLACGIA